MASTLLFDGSKVASPIESAVVWVEKAQKGSQNWVENCSEEQLNAYHLRKTLKPLTSFMKYLLLAIGIFEVPSWCLSDHTQCPGPNRPDLIHSGGVVFPTSVTNSIAIVIWIYLGYMLMLRRRALGKAHTFGAWHTFGAILIVIALADCLVGAFMTTGIMGFLPGKSGSFRISRILRPIIFLCFTKAIRDAATRTLRSIPYFADALLSLAIALFLFVWFGLIMFAKTHEGMTYFKSWSSAFTGLWILFTTANCPDVFLPTYTQHPTSFVFFFVYMVITIYLLSNILLAAVYDAYKEQLKDMIFSFDENQTQSVGHAFNLLASESGVITYPTWSSFFAIWMSGSSNDESHDHAYNVKRSKLIFDALDKDHSNGLDQKEFKMVLDALDHQAGYIPRKDGMRHVKDMYWAKSLRDLFLRGINLYGKHIAWDDVVDCIIAIDSFLTLLQTALFINGTGRVNDELLQPGSLWYKLLFTLSTFFLLEVLLKIIVFGFERFWHSKPVQHRFDMVTVFAQLLLNMYFLVQPNATWESGLRMILLLHVVRSLRLARHVEPLRFIGSLIVRLQPTYYRMGMLLVVVYYVYATFAEQALGGLLYKTNPDLKGTDYEANKYWPINFNDLMSGMVTLFCLMIVNNWFVFTGAFVKVAHSKWPVVFVVSFFVITNLVVLNILMALILDCSSALREELCEMERRYEAGLTTEEDSDKKYTYVDMLRRVLIDHDEHEMLHHSPTASLTLTQGDTYGSVRAAV